MVLVCDAETGFMITKKGRKDISDIGTRALPLWAEHMPKVMIQEARNKHGADVIETVQAAREAEIKKKFEDE